MIKYFKNFITIIKFYICLKHLTKQKKGIKSSKEIGDFVKEREYISTAEVTWSKYMLRYMKATVHIEGEENLLQDKPVVYMANHQGLADIPLLCYAVGKTQTGFIAKKSLSKIPLYGKWALLTRSVLIDRESPREAVKVIQTGVEYLNNGFSMTIFPEGTRSRGLEMAEFKKGSAKLATKAKVPVIPVSIYGTYKLFEEKGYVVPANIGVKIHPPIETANLTREEQNNISEKIENIVRTGVKELAEKLN